jgi:hypothetical protein
MEITSALVIVFSLLTIVMSADGSEQQNSLQPLIVGIKEAPPFSISC